MANGTKPNFSSVYDKQWLTNLLNALVIVHGRAFFLGERPSAQFYLLLARSLPNPVTVIAEELDLALIKLVPRDLLRKDELQMVSTRTGGFVSDWDCIEWVKEHDTALAHQRHPVWIACDDHRRKDDRRRNQADVKSTTVGFTAMIVSAILYFIWIRFWVLRNDRGLVSIDVHALLYWPVLVPIFLAGLLLAYRRVSRRRSLLTGGMSQ